MKIHEAVAPIAPIKPAAPAAPAAPAPAQPAAAPANPVATATQSTLDKLGARAGAAPGANTQQVADAYEQKLLDRMGKRFGLPPGSTAEQVQAAQQAHLDKNDPAAAAQYKQNMANIDAGNTAANTPVKLATPQAQQPAAAPGAAAPAAPAANPDDVGGQAAAKAGKSPIAIMLAQPTIGKNQAMLDVIAPTLGLPAGSSAEQILAADDARNKQAGNKYAAAPGAAQPVAEHYALDLLDYGKLVESQLDEVLSELYQTVGEGNDPHEPEAHDEFATDTYYDDEQGVAEGLEEYEGIKIKFSKDSDGVAIKALSNDGNKVLGSVELFFNEKGQLEPQDLWVNDRYQGQGIAKAMYDFLKNKGYTIIRSWDQTDAGAGFWDKHKGTEVNVWEQGVAEGWTKLPSGDYQNSHTGVRSSKPPVKKKRGEKTGAEWDAIEKAKKDKEQGVAEGLPQTLRKFVPGYARREIDKKMDAEKFGRTDVDKDANFQRYKKIQDKLKEQVVAEMDKSQIPPGRDGSNDPDAGKKEYTAKTITPKKAAKDGEKMLNKIFNKKKGVAEGSHEDQIAKAAAYNERMSSNTPPIDLGLRELGNWAKVGAYGDPIKSAWLNIAKYGVRNNRFKNSVDRVMTAIGNFPNLGDDVYDMYDINQNEVDILYDAYETVYDQWEQLQGQQGVAEGLSDTQKKIEDTINKLEDRLKHAKSGEQWDRISARIERLQAGLKRSKQGVAEGDKKPEPPEADYGAEYQDMVARVKKLAGLGPLKTVWDPEKRVYKNVPTAVQPKK